MLPHPIYLDYNATTPIDPAVRAAMLPFLDEVYGNPSSVHQIGRRARAALDDCRDRVACVWRCKPSEIVFTSGGTESVNLAILGAARRLRNRGRHIITSRVEHHAVLQGCEYLANNEGFEVTYLPVNDTGQVQPETLKRALRKETILVSVMAANNEIGTIQPVAELGKICRDRGIVFHTDAVQWFGKLPFDRIQQFNADLVSFCSHKIYGPKGAGALFIRSPLSVEPLLLGGGHEDERRAGTENLAAIVGLTEAIERFLKDPVFNCAHLLSLSDKLIRSLVGLKALGITVRGNMEDRLPNTVAFTVAKCDSISLLAALDLEGICASSGSACSAGSIQPSRVIMALGAPEEEANALVRFSLGRESTEVEIERVTSLLPAIIERIQNPQRSLHNV